MMILHCDAGKSFEEEFVDAGLHHFSNSLLIFIWSVSEIVSLGWGLGNRIIAGLDENFGKFT